MEIKCFKVFPESYIEIHRNERCEAMSSREWEQMHRKSVSQIGGWYVELEEVWMWKNVKLW